MARSDDIRSPVSRRGGAAGRDPRAAVRGYRRDVPAHVAVVVLAGGSGTRLGGAGNKAYLPLAGRPLVCWALQAFAGVADVRRLVLVVRPADRGLVEDVVAAEVRVPVEIVDGGASRHDSEYQAVIHLAPASRAAPAGSLSRRGRRTPANAARCC